MADTKKNLKENLSKALSRAKFLFTQSKLAVKQRLHLMEPIKILPFYGFGNYTYIFIKGRVMEEEKIVEDLQDQSVAGHLKDTYKRYETDEIPNIRIRASFCGKQIETKTDAEGFLRWRSNLKIQRIFHTRKFLTVLYILLIYKCNNLPKTRT